MVLLDDKNRLSNRCGRVLATCAVACLVLLSMGAAAFSLQPAQSAGASANETKVGARIRVAEITFTASTIDKSEMDLDAFARQIEGLRNLRSEDWMEEVKGRTRDFWQSHGFFKAQVDADSKLLSETLDERVFSVTARVHPGAQYRLKKLEFSGANVFTTPELESMMQIKPGEVFSTSQIRKGLETMRAAYLSKGYTQCTPIPTTMLDDAEHTISLTLNVEEGPQSK